MKIKYLGHSCFEIEMDKGKILIDPFLACSPNYNPEGVTDIFVTHAHGDHLGSAIEISKKTGAKITAIFELANYCANFGANTNGVGLGSWIEYDWGKAVAVPATHSSSTNDGIYGGCPCGYVFEVDGHHFYHAGDTSLNSEMQTLGEVYDIKLAMLPVGGHYTMDIEHAVKAAKMLQAGIVIPMHYNTFDAIKVDIEDFDALMRQNKKLPLIMNIGDVWEGL